MIVTCGMQAKLNRDHKNKLRNLRRQLKKKEDELQALQQQLNLAHQDPNTASSEPDLEGQQAAVTVVSKDGNAHVEDAAPGPPNQDVYVAKLEKELADTKAQCQQRRDVQQRASAEFADLMEENKILKLQMYTFRVSGS